MPTAGNGTTYSTPYVTAVKSLKVSGEVSSGYARTKFKHWDDADHDCRDTRAEVLRAASRKATTGTCTVKTGRWVSSYDAVVVINARQIDIDHLVPLAEAWESGARSWTAARREAFANDLADPRALSAVTAHANRSKGDRDPGEWQPIKKRCTYLANWVAIKARWGLTVDQTERDSLLLAVGRCGNPTVKVRKATVKNARAAPTGGTGGTSGPSIGGTDPRYGTCAEAISHGYGPYVRGKDPEYAWYSDRDHDGAVCE